MNSHDIWDRYAQHRGDVTSTERIVARDWPSEDLDVPVVSNLWQRVKGAIEAEPDRFDMNWWHGIPYGTPGCKTTHCMAGWIVVLADKDGEVLETLVGTPVAAALIHLASCPWATELPRFYFDDYGFDSLRCEPQAKKEIDKFAAEEALHTQQS